AGTARLSPDSVDEGERLLRKAHALVRPFGTTKTLARCLSALASARLFAGDLSDARSLHRQAIEVYRDLGEGVDDRRNLWTACGAGRSAAPFAVGRLLSRYRKEYDEDISVRRSNHGRSMPK